MTHPTSPFPWLQADPTRPVYSADGQLVSFTQNAARIIAAMNLIHDITETKRDVPTWISTRAWAVKEGKI